MITLLSDYDTNKQRNIVEHINWVLSELSAGVHKTVNRTGRTHGWRNLFQSGGAQAQVKQCIQILWLELATVTSQALEYDVINFFSACLSNFMQCFIGLNALYLQQYTLSTYAALT